MQDYDYKVGSKPIPMTFGKEIQFGRHEKWETAKERSEKVV